jgi:hypothetical protein
MTLNSCQTLESCDWLRMGPGSWAGYMDELLTEEGAPFPTEVIDERIRCLATPVLPQATAEESAQISSLSGRVRPSRSRRRVSSPAVLESGCGSLNVSKKHIKRILNSFSKVLGEYNYIMENPDSPDGKTSYEQRREVDELGKVVRRALNLPKSSRFILAFSNHWGGKKALFGNTMQKLGEIFDIEGSSESERNENIFAALQEMNDNGDLGKNGQELIDNLKGSHSVRTRLRNNR